MTQMAVGAVDWQRGRRRTGQVCGHGREGAGGAVCGFPLPTERRSLSCGKNESKSHPGRVLEPLTVGAPSRLWACCRRGCEAAGESRKEADGGLGLGQQR